MYQFPLGVFGVALGTVLFPRFARHAERREMKLLQDDLSAGVSLSISVGLPAGTGLMLLASPITALLFQRGAFTAEDSAQTSAIIAAYSAAVWAVVGLMVVNRAYYAVGDRSTPVRLGLYSVGVNLVLIFPLMLLVGGSGLAWATTSASIVQLAASLYVVQRKSVACLGPNSSELSVAPCWPLPRCRLSASTCERNWLLPRCSPSCRRCWCRCSSAPRPLFDRLPARFARTMATAQAWLFMKRRSERSSRVDIDSPHDSSHADTGPGRTAQAAEFSIVVNLLLVDLQAVAPS